MADRLEGQTPSGIDLEVRPGTVLGLLGPNGSGKTTAVRILTTRAAGASATSAQHGGAGTRTA